MQTGKTERDSTSERKSKNKQLMKRWRKGEDKLSGHRRIISLGGTAGGGDWGTRLSKGDLPGEKLNLRREEHPSASHCTYQIGQEFDVWGAWQDLGAWPWN